MFLLVYTDINANRCNDLPNNAPACTDRLEVSIMMENMEKVKDEAYKAAKEILEKAKLEKGDLFVVGCSTSEVCGETIGTHSKPELADMVFAGIYEATKEYGVYLAAQCCEHLNRALILEKWISVIHLSVCICRMSLYRPASRQNRLEMRMSYVPAPD